MSGTIVGRVRAKADQIWSKRIDAAGLARYLRDIHPEKTAINVAADTGIPADTVKKHIAGDVVPGGVHLLEYAAAYGPGALHAMFVGAPEWLSDAYRMQRKAELIAQQAAIEEEMRALSAK